MTRKIRLMFSIVLCPYFWTIHATVRCRKKEKKKNWQPVLCKKKKKNSAKVRSHVKRLTLFCLWFSSELSVGRGRAKARSLHQYSVCLINYSVRSKSTASMPVKSICKSGEMCWPLYHRWRYALWLVFCWLNILTRSAGSIICCFLQPFKRKHCQIISLVCIFVLALFYFVWLCATKIVFFSLFTVMYLNDKMFDCLTNFFPRY